MSSCVRQCLQTILKPRIFHTLKDKPQNPNMELEFLTPAYKAGTFRSSHLPLSLLKLSHLLVMLAHLCQHFVYPVFLRKVEETLQTSSDGVIWYDLTDLGTERILAEQGTS